MRDDTAEAVYRFQRFKRKGSLPGKYKGTLQVRDHLTEDVLAICDVIGDPVFAAQTVTDAKGRAWQMKANRRLMPSRWLVSNPGGQVVMQFDQKISRKLVNPLTRVMLALLDADGRERYRFVDPESNLIDKVMGGSPLEWAIVEGRTVVAKLVNIPRQKVTPKGIRGWVQRLLTGSDRCLVSLGPSHLLPAPAALSLIILLDALSSNTAT